MYAAVSAMEEHYLLLMSRTDATTFSVIAALRPETRSYFKIRVCSFWTFALASNSECPSEYSVKGWDLLSLLRFVHARIGSSVQECGVPRVHRSLSSERRSKIHVTVRHCDGDIRISRANNGSHTNWLGTVCYSSWRHTKTHFSEPVHFFSVCLAPIYGTEPKWLLLAELVEHYKLQV